MSKRRAEFVQWLGPVLEALRSLGGSGKPREVCDYIADQYRVSDKKLDETLKSGQTRYYNQVHWARQYLVWEGLLDGSTHGVWSLTQQGYETELTDEASRKIVAKWVKVHAAARRTSDEAEGDAAPAIEPQIVDEQDHKSLLLELLKKVTPEGFERVCARLLRESGFEKVTVTGRPKDGGIDGIGILQINAFVSFKVLFQCKRYKGSVSRAQV